MLTYFDYMCRTSSASYFSLYSDESLMNDFNIVVDNNDLCFLIVLNQNCGECIYLTAMAIKSSQIS